MDGMLRTPSYRGSITQIARKPGNTDVDPSVRIAISNLQNQIQALYDALNQAIANINSNGDSTGSTGIKTIQPSLMVLTNKSGSGRNLGDVVIFDAGNTGAFTTTTTQGDERVMGVIASDSPDGSVDAIAVDAQGYVCIAGRSKVRVDADIAAIAVGDYLIASTTAATARKALSPYDAGIFARALESKASGIGVISCEIFPAAIEQNARCAIQQAFDKLSYDLTGAITGFSGYVLSAISWRSADMSVLIERESYRYSADGNLVSSTWSGYDVAGTGVSTLHQTLNYSGELVESIVGEIA